MKLFKGSIYSCLCVCALLFFSCDSTDRSKPKAKDGKINLTHWNFNTDGSIKLSGEWEFYWKQFIPPDSFSVKNKKYHATNILVPDEWNTLEFGNEKLPADGFATYRLVVELPPNQDRITFKIKWQSTAYTLWANNRIVARQGKPGKSKTASKPAYKTIIKTFYLPNAESDKPRNLELVCHISNFHHVNSGLWDNIYIGTQENIYSEWRREIFGEIFMMGVLFVLAVYHFIVFGLLNNKTALWFALILLILFCRGFFLDNRIVNFFFENTHFEITNKISYIASFGLGFFFTMFFKQLYPKEFNKFLFFSLLVGNLVVIVTILVFPLKIYSSLKPYFTIFMVLSIVYIVGIVIPTAIYRKQKGAIMVLIAAIIAFATAIHDMLYSLELIKSYNLSNYGISVFAILQAYNLANIFSDAFKEKSVLTKNLQQLNDELELRVRERTREIELQRNKLLKQAQNLQEVHEKVIALDEFKDGMISMIVHDLKTPLNAIINTTKDTGVSQYGKQMLNMVLNILDIQKYEDAKMDLQIVHCDLHNAVVKAIRHIGFLAREKAIAIQIDTTARYQLMADADILERIFINILSNAIKYTPANGKITIDFKIEGGMVRISISDNGQGIPHEKAHLVFAKFGQVIAKKSGDVRSTGLGLTFCKMAVEAHGGKIDFYSKKNEGTTFWFTIPGTMLTRMRNQIPVFKRKDIILSQAEKKILQKHVQKLLQHEIYEISNIRKILREIPVSKSRNIHEWKNEVNNSMIQFNEKRFNELIKISMINKNNEL